MRIPCGQVLGHGDYCSEGHLCESCTEILRLQCDLEAANAALAKLPDVQRTKNPNTGTVDCWIHFKSSNGTHAQLSLAAIAEKSGPIVSNALCQWIIDRHGEP